MALQGERLIGASRETVWSALNDVSVLQATIPGCETIEALSATELNLIARLAFGGITGRFVTRLVLSDVQTDNGTTISAEGQDGGGSSFSSRTVLRLAEAAGGTRLSYEMSAAPAGAIAAEPPATLQTAARDYLDSFLSHFAAMVAPGAASPETRLQSQGKSPVSVMPVLEAVPPIAVPDDPAAHVAHAEPYHPPAHEDHDHDPSNPHYFGLPLGVILAGIVAGISVCITIVKFLL